jgi:hypothetical protein
MKLTDTQLVILSAASQRADRAVLPLALAIDEAESAKILRLLLKKNLITEAVAEGGADGLMVHRTDKHGTRYGLVISNRGLAVLGVEPEAPAHEDRSIADAGGDADSTAERPVQKGRHGANARAAKPASTGRRRSAPVTENARRAPRPGTKQAKLIAMLRRPDGATVAQIAKATGWQHHTVRGAIAGALKKKLGMRITTGKNDAGARVYRITG